MSDTPQSSGLTFLNDWCTISNIPMTKIDLRSPSLDSLVKRVPPFERKKPKVYPHRWVFKASWPSTAMTFKMDGRNVAHAKDRAWLHISRQPGGDLCLTVEPLEQLN